MHTNLRVTDLNSFSDKDFWVGFVHFNESLGELVKTQPPTHTHLLLKVSASVGLGWDPRIYSSNKFSNPDAAGPGATP